MPECAGPKLSLLKGKILDAAGGKSLGACITVTDNVSNEVIAKLYSNEKTGEYLLPLPAGHNYGIAIEKEGCLFHSENICMSDKDNYQEVTKDIPLVKIESGAKVVLKNIFFDTGKSDIKPESNAELARLVTLLNQNPKVKIEVSGHTDNLGDAEANKKLSELRATKVSTFLIGKGISATRITVKGYGSAQPLESNTTAEGRKMNRRTEFKIL